MPYRMSVGRAVVFSSDWTPGKVHGPRPSLKEVVTLGRTVASRARYVGAQLSLEDYPGECFVAFKDDTTGMLYGQLAPPPPKCWKCKRRHYSGARTCSANPYLKGGR